MQVERQWKLLRLIPDKLNRRSTDELWNALRSDVEYDDVSKRTVERDLAFLQTLFPLEQSTEGRTNYWYWRERAAMWLPGMTDDEALVFHMVERNMGDLLPEVSVERLSAYFSAATARLKNMPKGIRSWGKKFRVLASGVPRIARKRFNPEPTRVIRQALLNDHSLVISVYCKGLTSAKTIQTREIRANPLALVQLDRELLLVYTEHGSSSPQYLRLQDVDAASVASQEFDGPATFDIDNYIESGVLNAKSDLPIEVGKWIQMSISLDRDEWMRWAISPLAVSEVISRDDDGRTRLVMPIRFTSDLSDWLLGLGPKVRVHQPLELRKWIAQKTREAADQYRGESVDESPLFVAHWLERWEDRRLVCNKCSWTGQARQKELEQAEAKSASHCEFRCPRCNQLLLSVNYSATKLEIMEHWDELDESTRAAVLSTPEHMSRFEREKLKSVDDLPDLKNGLDYLKWGLVHRKDGSVMNEVSQGRNLLWRQPAVWAGAEEFVRVCDILRQRYGACIKRVVVSSSAMGFLVSKDPRSLNRISAASNFRTEGSLASLSA